jgi:hypothetical protein
LMEKLPPIIGALMPMILRVITRKRKGARSCIR